ncbi:MAG: histidine phosphatase family protein [Candidatus Woesearchaeota archaeon]
MRLILVRHGETVENANEIMQGHLPGKLNDKGIKQAKKVAERLKDEKIDYIYCSDLARAVDTSKEIVKYHLGIPIKYVKELREKHYGIFQGKKHSEIDFENDPEGGETMAEFTRRVMDFLEKVINQHVNDTVLFIFHGGPMGMIMSKLRKIDYNEFMRDKGLKNTGVSIIDFDKDKNINIRSCDCIEHLK